MEKFVTHKNKQTEKMISLLCLLSLLVSACSSTSNIKKIAPIAPINQNSTDLNKPIHKEEGAVSGQLILNFAKSQLGKSYRYGGASPKMGFDCSGLSWYSHKENGIKIPRISSDQFKKGKRILRKDLKTGDLVFFETYRPGASHVGIYAGKGDFIHSPRTGKKVTTQKLSNNYYKKRYLGARRYW